MRLLPLALVDQLLHLLQLSRRQGHLIVTRLLLLTEDRGVHAIEGVTGARTVYGGAESTDAQHRGGHRPDDGETPPSSTVADLSLPQRRDGVGGGDRGGEGRVAHLIAELGEEEGQLGLGMVGWIGLLLGSERLEELVGPVDLVERWISAIARPASEIRHRVAPFRSTRP